MKKIYVTKSVLPPYDQFVEKIKSLWETRMLTNMGSVHQELEKSLQEYLRVPYVSLMVNGHMALEMTIQAFGFPDGGEVITTPFTFISTTHAIVRNRLKPVFCDIKPDDYTIDEEKIEELITEKTVAVVPVHVYGNPCNVEKIQEIAERYGLKVIYDACHAFGETLGERGIGSFGDASIFSFHATKVFHTVEGGAAVFSDPQLYDKLYNLKNFGIRGEELVVDIGANAKMNEFCAAMGLCNLPYVEENIKLRKVRTEWYIESLKGENLKLPNYEKREVFRNYGYFPVLFEKETIRNEVYRRLRMHEIYARKYFYPLTSDAECFQGKYSALSLEQARKISASILVLPLYPELSYEDVERICHIIKDVLRGMKKTD